MANGGWEKGVSVLPVLSCNGPEHCMHWFWTLRSGERDSPEGRSRLHGGIKARMAQQEDLASVIQQSMFMQKFEHD
jgi:hypothetical protein